jgi:hypothetical protein
MKAVLIVIAGSVSVPHAVLAGPQETVMFTGVPSNGVLNSSANSVRTGNLIGGYTLGRIDLSGSLTAVHQSTWRTDSRVLITAPDGLTSIVFQPFTSGTTYSTLTFSRSLYFPAGTVPAGTWTLRFFEVFDDGGTALIDATWNLTVVFTNDQPVAPIATNLGVITWAVSPTIFQESLSAGQVRWYRFTTQGLTAASNGRYVDIDTAQSDLPAPLSGQFPNDTSIALYDASGNLIVADDDSGPGFTSQLTFGAGTRPGLGDGQPYDGRHGPLPAGAYYLAVGAYPTAFNPVRWEASSTGSQVGTIRLTIGTNQGAPCYVNCDASTVTPILNVNDFICFQNKYAASDPYANCDASTLAPVLNVNDFTCFLNKYAAGCP